MMKKGMRYIDFDEIMGALYNQLIAIDEACSLIHHKPEQMELILTAGCSCYFIELADYVSEIKMVKYPFPKGSKPGRIEY